MRNLFEGIYSKFENDTALAAAVTDLYNTEAKPNAAFPYIVFSLVNNTTSLDSSQKWENYMIRFNIFDDDNSSGTVCDIYELLKGDTAAGTGFDYFDLVIDNYDTVILKRTSANLTKIDHIWQYTVLYELQTTYTGVASTAKYCIHLYNLLGI